MRWRGLPGTDRVLHIDLGGRDPDDGCTLVPYEKGALLLRTIEQRRGPRPLRRLSARLLRPLRLPEHHHRGFSGLRAARAAQRRSARRVDLPARHSGRRRRTALRRLRAHGSRLARRYERLEHAGVAAFPALAPGSGHGAPGPRIPLHRIRQFRNPAPVAADGRDAPTIGRRFPGWSSSCARSAAASSSSRCTPS